LSILKKQNKIESIVKIFDPPEKDKIKLRKEWAELDRKKGINK